ncbi:MAG: Zn-ribbon containing protein [Candidatus Woesearchaeota archaeon]
MSHQCVRCNTFYEDGSEALLKGCNNCGGKFFFFVKKESQKEAQALTRNLTDEDKNQMEKDVKEIIGDELEDLPIILDLENIKVLKPGKFELDLVDLFRKKPLVYRLEEGKYFIDVPSTFAADELGIEEEKENKKQKSNKEE